MLDEVYEKYEIELYDSINDIRNIVKYVDKDKAIKDYKRFRLLYKDRLTVTLTYTKSYIHYPLKSEV